MNTPDDWRHQAACRDMDGDLFFAPDQERANRRNPRVAEAKRVCDGCPVRQECGAEAETDRIPYGVWGGLDEDERGTSRRPKPKTAGTRKPPAPAKSDPITRPSCGRQRGYDAHTANGERQCDVCKAWRSRGKRAEAA
jgi:WhiB family redox-sensing transcriptional regulator